MTGIIPIILLTDLQPFGCEHFNKCEHISVTYKITKYEILSTFLSLCVQPSRLIYSLYYCPLPIEYFFLNLVVFASLIYT